MSILSSIYHVAGKAVAPAAKLAGGLTGSKQLTNLGTNISNPKVTFSNPAGVFSGGNKAFTGAGAYGASVGRSQPTAQNAGSTYDPYGGVGGNYGSSGYGSSAQSASDAALLNNLRTQATQRIQGIQAAYDALNQSLDSSVADRSNQVSQNYTNQTNQLNDSYKDTSNQLAGQYENRGLGDSSYNSNAQDTAAHTYNDNLNSINTSKSNDLAQLGQIAQQGHAQYNSGKSSYNDYLNNLGNYGAADLQTLVNNFGQAQSQLAQSQAGQGTQAQYLQALNAINPTQNQGTSQLAAQLQTLASSSTPGFAKNTIAQGLISQAGVTDPTQKQQWQDQFKQLTAGS